MCYRVGATGIGRGTVIGRPWLRLPTTVALTLINNNLLVLITCIHNSHLCFARWNAGYWFPCSAGTGAWPAIHSRSPNRLHSVQIKEQGDTLPPPLPPPCHASGGWCGYLHLIMHVHAVDGIHVSMHPAVTKQFPVLLPHSFKGGLFRKYDH